MLDNPLRSNQNNKLLLLHVIEDIRQEKLHLLVFLILDQSLSFMNCVEAVFLLHAVYLIQKNLSVFEF